MKPLKILFVSSELAPLVVTGGLADVAAALPRALTALGHDVRIALPGYDLIPPEHRGEQFCMCVADLGGKTAHGAMRASVAPGTDIPLYLIEHEEYFGRKSPYGVGAYEYEDNAERFCFFSLAVLHGVAQLGWRPDVVHCHDWHTATIPAFIKTRLAHTAAWRHMPTLFTIHNLAYQGRYKARFMAQTGLSWDLFNPQCLEFHGDLNLMKGAIAFSSKINTVSPRYAREIQTPEYGEGLDGFLRTRRTSLSGILNGVDYTVWSPEKDPHIPVCYSRDDLKGKQVCKRALQERLGLPQLDVPLFGMVSRIRWQKGIDLVADALDAVMHQDLQLVVLGTGDPYLENILWQLAGRYPGKMRVLLQFDVGLSHLIEAGSDFFLMPSRFEPCGLSQMYSLAYGTIPIVRKTGGLADSVRPITNGNLSKGRATGIVFEPIEAQAVAQSMLDAIDLYANPDAYGGVQAAGMREDFSWERSSKAYVRLYRQAMRKP
ncbi:MAG: glycogen synthase GlgA [Nitrospiraceae bacterium]|nr:glycogen synthase GlgA [Nitrospiraceae bacterium]